MGINKHNTIIVTASTHVKEEMTKVWDKAVELFGSLVSPIIVTELNGYISFLVATDGSKENWEESDDGDNSRRILCDFIDTFAYEDGSSSFEYIDVAYGEVPARIERTNNLHHNLHLKLANASAARSERLAGEDKSHWIKPWKVGDYK